ncbi:MAG: polysaccharide deacetylase family protein [bacterium]|nr:polysaccharide deacetylase family protein [bacterium]
MADAVCDIKIKRHKMGNTIKQKINTRTILFIILLISITTSVVFAYPYAKNVLGALHHYSIEYYTYKPKQPVVSTVDTSTMPPAIAVPMLMYHGVIYEKETTNTTVRNFIKHMEMLKENGFETITVAEYDLFRQGKFTLPPRPIIITFDDGRKDSFYTTDDVFKKLGFEATIFVATGEALEGNSFYLTWDELRTLRDSGRWELEAHGRDSHDVIALTQKVRGDEDTGRYLNSKMYLTAENRIETTEEFEKRIEEEYVNGINDLKNYLNINPRYYAIPLNDYGQQDVTNYAEAIDFNQEVIKRHFRLSFIEANDPSNVTVLRFPVYNFKDQDPYRIKRIEVKNMATEDLKDMLLSGMPVSPQLSLHGDDFSTVLFDNNISEAHTIVDTSGLIISSLAADNSGKIVFGEPYWDDYTVTAHMKRIQGKSVALLMYYKDANNYLSLGISENDYFLRTTVNGKNTDLRIPYRAAFIPNETIEFKAVIKDNKISTYIDGYPLFRNVIIKEQGGKTGIKVWDPTGKAQAQLSSLEITPTL